MLDTTLAWLATYLIHSSVLILGVWGFTHWCTIDSLTRSLLWKLALVGGLFTATLQTGFGVRPALGHYAVAAAPVPPPTIAIADEMEAIEDDDADASSVVVLEVHDGARSVTVVSMRGDAGPAWEPMPVAAPSPVVADVEEPDAGGAAPVLVGLFLGGAALGLGRLLITARRLRRLLAGRGDLTRGSLAERLALLMARARLARRAVRLTMSPALCSPIALASREIVVPEAALDLEPRQQEAMLAHELAHVVRQDPAWLVLAAVIEAALFIQPLNRLARAGMQTAAEELADDWAVRHLGTGLHLARCLTEVASWQGRARVPGAFVSPMASGDTSALVHRVQRLLDDEGRERGRWTAVRRVLVGVGALAAVTLGAPGLSVAVAEARTIEVADLGAVAAAPAFVFADDDAPLLAMLDARNADDRADERAPTGREKRMVRRAQRLERKAAKAEAKAARLRADGDRRGHVHVVRGDESFAVPSRAEVAEIERQAAEAVRNAPSRAEVAEIERQAAEAVRDAPSRVEVAEIERQAEEAVRDAERQVRQMARDAARMGEAEVTRQLGQLGRDMPRIDTKQLEALQRQAERLGRDMPRIDTKQLEARQAERLGREMPRIDAKQLEALQRQAEKIGREMSKLDVKQLEALGRGLEPFELGEHEVRRIEAAAERAGGAAVDAARGALRDTDMRAIEAMVRDAVRRAPGIDRDEARRIEAEVHRELEQLGAKARKSDRKGRAKAERKPIKP